MSSPEERKDRALKESLKKTLKRKYPNDWKNIVKCIEDAIDAGLQDQALEDEIEKCLQNIAAVTALDRDQLKKAPRSHIHVGG